MPAPAVSSSSPRPTSKARVEAAIQRGKDIVKKQVQIDADGLKTEIDSL